MAVAVGSPPGSVEQSLAESIHGLVRGVLHELQPTLEAQGLSMGRFWALHVVSSLEDPTLTRIARHLSVRGPTACASVDGLERAGLVERHRSERDHRVVRLVPTSKGRRTEAAVWRAIGAALGEATAGLPPEEVRTTARTLAALVDRLDRPDRGPRGRSRR